jgi:hypothetical protein
MFLFRCLGGTKIPVEVRGFVYEYFVKKIRFHGEELLAARPNPKLVGCPRMHIQYFCSYPPYWGPLLHQQPEEAPRCCDRDPLITWT